MHHFCFIEGVGAGRSIFVRVQAPVENDYNSFCRLRGKTRMKIPAGRDLLFAATPIHGAGLLKSGGKSMKNMVKLTKKRIVSARKANNACDLGTFII